MTLGSGHSLALGETPVLNGRIADTVLAANVWNLFGMGWEMCSSNPADAYEVLCWRGIDGYSKLLGTESRYGEPVNSLHYDT
jgi:hypothetical protein